MRRNIIGTAAALGVLALAATAPAAYAMPTATTNVSIVDATKGACSGGMANWTVHPRITINNDSADTDTISDVAYTGKYGTGGGQVATSDTQVIDSGGLDVGISLAPGESRTFLPTVGINIACTATSASLFVNYDLVNGHKTFTGGAQFLSNATAVPTGAVGALGLVTLVGLTVALRRRKPAEVKVPVGG